LLIAVSKVSNDTFLEAGGSWLIPRGRAYFREIRLAKCQNEQEAQRGLYQVWSLVLESSPQVSPAIPSRHTVICLSHVLLSCSYVGEVTLWAGLALAATPALAAFPSSSFLFSPYIAAISPLFEYILITKASGVPILGESAEKKWGKTKEWQDYKSKVPVFFALPGSKI
jgi:hypothetical protein